MQDRRPAAAGSTALMRAAHPIAARLPGAAAMRRQIVEVYGLAVFRHQDLHIAIASGLLQLR